MEDDASSTAASAMTHPRCPASFAWKLSVVRPHTLINPSPPPVQIKSLWNRTHHRETTMERTGGMLLNETTREGPGNADLQGLMAKM